MNPKELPHKAGSVGRPVQGMTVSVRRRNGREAKAFEIGEVVVQGPCLMTGYLGDADGTEAILTNDGYFTGDYGYIDKDGCLWIKGRRDDIFKSGAEKVSTQAITDMLFATGMCQDVAVVPVKDPFLGKVPHAFIVPAGRFDRRLVLNELRKSLAPSHLPKKFIIVDEIPRTGSGKVRVSELRSDQLAPAFV